MPETKGATMDKAQTLTARTNRPGTGRTVTLTIPGGRTVRAQELRQVYGAGMPSTELPDGLYACWFFCTGCEVDGYFAGPWASLGSWDGDGFTARCACGAFLDALPESHARW